MKNNTTNKSRFETQIRQSIKDAAAVKFLFSQKTKTNGPEVRNHLTFGVAGGRYSTGPPGRARSPDFYTKRYPDHPPNEGDAFTPDIRGGPETEYVLSVGQTSEINLNTEYQVVINKNKKSFFINI